MLSGGIDSLFALYDNLDRFPVGHPHRITRGIRVQGFNQLPAERVAAVQPLISAAVAKIASDTGIRYTVINTNVREMETDLPYWGKVFHGPVLAGAAHALVLNRGNLWIGSTFDAATMMAPRGSHPLIDAHFSTERLSVLHDSVAFSRLEKVRALAKHGVALDNAQICGSWKPGYLNCGSCEKCVRTKLAYVIAGHPIPPSFRDRDVTPSHIRPIRAIYQADFYREMAEPLRLAGRRDITAAINRRLTFWRPKHAVRLAAATIKQRVASGPA